MSKMRTIRLLALLLALSLLSGCSGPVPLRDETSATLPPVENKYTAPVAGAAREYAETVQLYLPSVSDNQLITVPERILIPSDQHPAEATVRKLLSFTGSETARPLFPEALLRLQEGTQALEISGDIATVNLSANAGLLSKQDLFVLRRAIANTLMQWRDIRYVNVLITGMEPGVDQASLTPAGSMQFTRNDTLWGVPQLTDAGIAVFYNAELLEAAGISAADLQDLRWGDPGDTLRPLLSRLTVDAAGRSAATPGFDPRRTRVWGYNAANDLQAINLNFVGSAGGTFSRGDAFTFDNPGAAEAFGYLVDLINTAHLAPPASDTNDNGDFSRNQFLAGRMALFQSGTYNLANVAERADFRWGIAPMPRGPAGRVSVTNGIIAAGNAASAHPKQVRRLLDWLGSTEGNAFLGAGGVAIPAVRAAQRGYFDYWSARGVQVGPFFEVLAGPHIEVPAGAGAAAGLQRIKPFFDEMFLGRLPVDVALRDAEAATRR